MRAEAFETTLAGLGYVSHTKAWRAAGYPVSLFFRASPNAEEAIARVALRVSQGGHRIPEEVIRRRFAAGTQNLETAYKPAVNAWAKSDNEGASPVLREWGDNP